MDLCLTSGGEGHRENSSGRQTLSEMWVLFDWDDGKYQKCVTFLHDLYSLANIYVTQHSNEWEINSRLYFWSHVHHSITNITVLKLTSSHLPVSWVTSHSHGTQAPGHGGRVPSLWTALHFLYGVPHSLSCSASPILSVPVPPSQLASQSQQ